MSTENRRIVLNTFLLGLVAALGVGTVVWILSVDRSDPVDDSLPVFSEEAASEDLDLIDFDSFQFDEERLQQEWAEAREHLDDIEIGLDEERLLETYHDANRQAAEGEASSSQLAALNELFTMAVGSYISAHGPRAYQLLSWHVYDEFEDAVTRVQERAGEGNTTVAEILNGSGAEARSLREVIGQYFEFATELGIIDNDGSLRYRSSLMAVVFRYRWFKFSETYPPLSLMTPYERTVFQRWRIEAAEGIPLLQRLAMIDEAANVYVPIVDLDALRALVYAREGDTTTALELLRAAAERHPDDLRYNGWISVLEEE